MRATVRDGWLILPCDAPSTAQVDILVAPEGEWVPAFRDTDPDGTRVAMIRLAFEPGRATVIAPRIRVANGPEEPVRPFRV